MAETNVSLGAVAGQLPLNPAAPEASNGAQKTPVKGKAPATSRFIQLDCFQNFPKFRSHFIQKVRISTAKEIVLPWLRKQPYWKIPAFDGNALT
jgi:hypothetical protein